MCLEKLMTKRNLESPRNQPEKEGRYQVGWKIFHLTGNRRLKSDIFGSKYLPVGQWLHEKDFRDKEFKSERNIQMDFSYKRYPFGWHIYVNKKRMDRFQSSDTRFRKVYFRRVVAKGFDAGWPVFVAKEMFIVPLGIKK